MTRESKSASFDLRRHQRDLSECRRCPAMTGPVVIGRPAVSSVLLIGQAPGSKEIDVGRPFAWTAGKTLFSWFDSIGVGEERFRERVYMAAVCRCFPGKNPKGGDRVPAPEEIQNCSFWLEREVRLLAPRLILPVGKLAIAQLTPVQKLADLVGRKLAVTFHGVESNVIPLPHPSGASTWHRTEPGKSLLAKALRLVRRHPAWIEATG